MACTLDSSTFSTELGIKIILSINQPGVTPLAALREHLLTYVGKLDSTNNNESCLNVITNYLTEDFMGIVNLTIIFTNKKSKRTGLDVSDIINKLTTLKNNLNLDTIKAILHNLAPANANNVTDTNIALITTEEYTLLQKDIQELFLNLIYGDAVDVRDLMLHSFKDMMFLATTLNLGDIEGTIGAVNSTAELNRNIRAYLNKLLNEIIQTILELQKTNPNIQFRSSTDKGIITIINNAIKNNTNLDIWTADARRIRTNALLLRILPVIKNIISDTLGLTPTILEDMKLIADSPTHGNEERALAAAKLKLFNDFVTLNHFDDLIKLLYNKRLVVHPNYIDSFSTIDKYIINEKGSGLISNFRIKDAVVEDEIDPIMINGIERLPYYAFGSHIPTDNYLSVTDFYNAFCALKGIVDDVEAYNTFGDSDLTHITDEKARKFFYKATNLAKALTYVRENPVQNIKYIMDLIFSPDYYQTHKNLINRHFNRILLNNLYSCYRGIFSNDAKSYYSINKTNRGQFFSYFTQSIDSIFPVGLVSTVRDSNGRWIVKKYTDKSYTRIKSIIETGIDVACSRELSKIKNNTDPWLSNNVTTYDSEKKVLTIKVPSSKGVAVTLTIDNDLNCNLITPSDPTNPFVFSYEDTNLRLFIDDTLGLNLNRDEHFADALLKTYSNFDETSDEFYGENLIQGLLLYAGRARYLLNLCLLNKDAVTKSDWLAILKELNFYFSDHNTIKFFSATNEIGKTSKKDVPMLNHITNAYGYLNHANTGSLIIDSLGNGQTVQSFSKLLGSYRYLFSRIAENPDNPMFDALILDPAIFNEIVQIKELAGKGSEYKSAELYNFNEFTEQSLLDFLSYKMTDSDNLTLNSSMYGQDKIGILASVNSDKPNIGHLVLNVKNLLSRYGISIERALNTTVTEYAREKNLSNLLSGNESVFDYILKSEFCKIYAKIAYNAQSVLDKINDVLTNKDGLYNYPEIFKYLQIQGLSLQGAYLNNFDKFNTVLLGHNKTYGTLYTGKLILKEVVKAYNMHNRTTPIALTEEMIARFEKDGSVKANEVVLSSLYKFMDLNVYNALTNNLLGAFKYIPNLSNIGYRIFKRTLAMHILNLPSSTINDANFVEIFNSAKAKKGLMDYQQFMELKDKLVLEGLLKHNFKLNVLRPEWTIATENKDKRVSRRSIFSFPDIARPLTVLNENNLPVNLPWVDANTEYLILGYVDVNTGKVGADGEPLHPLWKPITNNYDIITYFGEETDNVDIYDYLRTKNIIINPVFDQINKITYLFSLEWQNATVGTCADLAKSGKTIESTIAAKYKALDKRNNQHTALMHEFLLNLLDGIPSAYNVGMFTDLNDLCFNSSGGATLTNVTNAGTIVNPFIVYLENKSLGSNAAGITKKLFVTTYLPSLGTTLVIKTAGFGLTNNNMQEAVYETLMRKMTDHTWKRADGTAAEVDLTKSYITNTNGDYSTIAYDPCYIRTNVKYDSNFNPINGERGVFYYLIANITSLGSNLYTVKYLRCNSEGKVFANEAPIIRQNVEINTNYKLWKLFGGNDCYELAPNSLELTLSERSITNVVKAMNNVFDVQDAATARYAEVQDDLYLPLKHSDIHYFCSVEAIKHGYANVNDAEALLDDTTDIDFVQVLMHQAGIQLDKEHHADESEVRLMTLVVSACAAKGYTYLLTQELYKALASLTKSGVSEFSDSYNLLLRSKLQNPNEPEKWDDTFEFNVAKAVIKALSDKNMTSSNFVTKIANDIWNHIKSTSNTNTIKQYIKDHNLPYSDNAVYNLMLSAINILLTKKGIKLHVLGTLAVMTPSYKVLQLHGNLTREQVRHNPLGLSPEEYLEFLLNDPAASHDGTVPVVCNTDLNDPTHALFATGSLKNLKIGRHYIIDGHEVSFVADANHSAEEVIDYFNKWSNLIREGRVKFAQEDIRKGRELDTYTVHFKCRQEGNPNEQLYLLWNLDTTRNLHLLTYLKESYSDASLLIIKDTLNTLVSLQRVAGRINYKQFIDFVKANYLNLAINLTEAQSIFLEKYAKYMMLSAEYLEDSIWTSPDTELSNTSIIDDITKLLDKLKEIHLRDLNNISTTAHRSYSAIVAQAFDECQEKINKLKKEKLVDARAINESLANVLKIVNFTFGRKITDFTQSAKLNFSSKERIKYNELLLPIISNNKFIPFNEANLHIYKEALTNIFAKYFDTVQINDQAFTVIPDSISTDAYGVKMPKTAMTDFGLRKFDLVNEILKDKEFFTKRMREQFANLVDESNYTVTLKRINGDHFYLLSKSEIPNTKLLLLREVPILEENGKKFVASLQGKPSFEIYDGDEVYLDPDTNKLIIAVNEVGNFTKYFDDLNYLYILFSNKLFDTDYYESVLQALGKSTNNHALSYFADLCSGKSGNNTYTTYRYNKYSKHFTTRTLTYTDKEHSKKTYLPLDQTEENVAKMVHASSAADFIERNRALNDFGSEEALSKLRKRGEQVWVSFNKYLDVIAARIPAQSMQSFMPMKIEEFEDEDVNNAYVSTMQIWLLGSDYDIDTVNLVTYDIGKNGILDIWSPFARYDIYAGPEDISPIKNLEDSMKYLPFPSGLDAVTRKFTKREQTAFFNKYKDLFNIETTVSPAGLRATYATLKEDFDILLLGSLLREAYLPDTLLPYENDIFDFAKKCLHIYNQHHLYINTIKNPSKVDRITTNLMQYRMYSVGADPVNLLEALAPIDEITDPFIDVIKHPEKIVISKAINRGTTEKTPGNFTNMFEGIENNLIGKSCIGINAIGLKTFLNLTLYYNAVLNLGTVLDLDLLSFPGTNGISFTVPTKMSDGTIRPVTKHFYLLTNANPNNPNTIKSAKILSELLTVELNHDTALDDSVMISLSADNAKLLALAELRANPKTTGMYNAALMVGMPFNDIASLFMGDVGTLVLDLAKSDIFNGIRDTSSLNMDRIFDYLDPEKPLHIPDSIEALLITEVRQFALNSGEGNYWDNPNRLELPDDASDLAKAAGLLRHMKSSLAIAIVNLAVEKCRKSIDALDKNHYEWRAIDDFKKLIYYRSIIKEVNNHEQFTSILKLYQLSLEFFTMGRISSLNLGLKSASDEIHNLLDIFTDLGIDLERFVSDKKYQEQCVSAYEENRVAINIPHVILNVPHLFEYVSVLAKALEGMNGSIKFRTLRSETDNIIKHFCLKDRVLDAREMQTLLQKNRKETRRALTSFINDTIHNEWLSTKEVYIPEGTPVFDRNGNLSPAPKGGVMLLLGTEQNNATFRKYIEDTIIPNLLRGILQEGQEIDPRVMDNLFIKDLKPRLFNKTVLKNNSIIYSLSINMSPRKGTKEEMLLENYRKAFKQLAAYTYRINDGKINHDINLHDLFFYYTLLAQNWSMSEGTLTNIFKNIDSSLQKDFYAFEKEFDDRKNGISFKFGENVSYQLISPYLLSFDSPYTSKKDVIKAKDNNTGRYEYMLYSESTSMDAALFDALVEMFGDEFAEEAFDAADDENLRYTTITEFTLFPDRFGDYTQRADDNYFLKGIIQTAAELNIKDGKNKYKIVYNPLDRKIDKVNNVPAAVESALKGLEVPTKIKLNLDKGQVYKVIDNEKMLDIIKAELDAENSKCF